MVSERQQQPKHLGSTCQSWGVKLRVESIIIDEFREHGNADDEAAAVVSWFPVSPPPPIPSPLLLCGTLSCPFIMGP